MSKASLRQDSCSYKEQLKRSVGPGMYMLATPPSDCSDCGRDIPNDPHIRWQNWGPGFCDFGSTVDVGSELKGLNYKNTLCSQKQYKPGTFKPPMDGVCAAKGKQDPRKCAAPTESTRLSNPPCTLRATGWNRWEWLCYDPQDKAVVPFDYLVSNRIMIKDNHQPCIPNPVDETPIHPTEDTIDSEKIFRKWKPPQGCGATAPGNPNQVSWRSCKEIQDM